MNTIPEHIELARGPKELIIEWANGARSRHSWTTLRSACPCAQCRKDKSPEAELSADRDDLIPLISTGSTDIESLEIVGNYALQILWKDGHRYGIYGWDYLKSLPQVES